MAASHHLQLILHGSVHRPFSSASHTCRVQIMPGWSPYIHCIARTGTWVSRLAQLRRHVQCARAYPSDFSGSLTAVSGNMFSQSHGWSQVLCERIAAYNCMGSCKILSQYIREKSLGVGAYILWRQNPPRNVAAAQAAAHQPGAPHWSLASCKVRRRRRRRRTSSARRRARARARDARGDHADAACAMPPCAL